MKKRNSLFNLLLVFVALFTVFSLSGCDLLGDDDDDKIVTELEGSWGSSAFVNTGNGNDGIAGTSDDEWEKMNAVFSGNSMVFNVENAEGVSLSNLTLLVRYSVAYTFAIGEAVTTPAGAKKIDYTQVSLTVTPLSAAAVTYLNSNSGWTYTDWQLNVPKNCAGKLNLDGGTEDANGKQIYDIFQVKTDNKLYFGDDGANVNYDGTTDAKRPQVLESDGFPKL